MKNNFVFVAISFLLLLFVGTVSASTVSEITTEFKITHSGTGNMFNVTNDSTENVTLTGKFAGNFWTSSTGTVEIWYRTGGYENYETDESTWTKLGEDSYSSAAQGSETWFDVENSLLLSPGDKIGVYMYDNDYNMLYSCCSNTYSDSYLSIATGIGGPTEGRFKGDLWSPRTWNGTIEYEYGSAPVPEPATMLLFCIGLLGLAGVNRRKTA